MARGLVAIFGALAVAGVVVAAVVGWRAGFAATSPTPAVSGESRAVRLGPAHLTLPSTWTPVSPARAGVSRLDPDATIAFAILPSLSGHALVTLAAPTDRSLIPSSLRRALKAAPGRPRPTALAGYRAWSYQSVALWRRDAVMDVAVVPTSAGVLAVACVAPRVVFGAVAGCELDVQRISLPGARVFAPAPELAFRLQVAAALERLNHLRARGDTDLRAARSRGGQSRALRVVAAAYTDTAEGLAPFAPQQGAPAAVVAAMRDAARAYRAAGEAAATGSSRRYTAGRTTVRAAEAQVARALQRVSRRPGA
ncbi:MAG TPA: hypothetical protein VES79_03505 [Solirubrobacteraceae bacterium]|nr:hypothetical protein [Solirubrobacteraceae bacterium]